MDAKATAKYMKGSPQKARLVIDQIRGKNVEEALSLLEFSRQRAARQIAKVLRSAVSNAEEQSPSVDIEELFVKEAYVDLGPTKHRFRLMPAPQGRAFRQRRRQRHITVQVSDERE